MNGKHTRVKEEEEDLLSRLHIGIGIIFLVLIPRRTIEIASQRIKIPDWSQSRANIERVTGGRGRRGGGRGGLPHGAPIPDEGGRAPKRRLIIIPRGRRPDREGTQRLPERWRRRVGGSLLPQHRVGVPPNGGEIGPPEGEPVFLGHGCASQGDGRGRS